MIWKPNTKLNQIVQTKLSSSLATIADRQPGGFRMYGYELDVCFRDCEWIDAG